jgi:hypothetical protein
MLVAACVLGSLPILDMGVNDDWSYAWTARAFATTGHLAYNGWVGAMVGVQAIWAGLLIGAFGMSFTLVRLSTLPLAAGCAILLYRLGRYAGLDPRFALFGTVTVTLSPVFIPLAASFMTDVPGFFFWLACLYCAGLALRAESTARACGWLAVAAALGVAGGTVRQAVWIMPLTALPTVALIRRRERRTVAAAAGLCCASALAMGLCLRWFHAQPNTGAGAPEESFTSLEFLEDAVETFFQIVLGCLLFALPVLAIHLAGWRKRLRAESIPKLLGGLLAVGALLGIVLWWYEDDLLPGNIVTAVGILDPRLDALGEKAEILSAPVRVLLGLAIFVCAGFTAAALLDGFRRRRKAGLRGAVSQPEEQPAAQPEAAAALGRFALLTIPPCLIYTAALLYRGVVWRVYDRYLIVLLPVLVIPLLWQYQHKIRKPLPRFGWALIAVLAWYGVAITHDYMAAGRARLRAASALTAAGIPRTRITAGLEYDAWTELERTGLIRVRTTADPPYPFRPGFWFWNYTPSVDPLYFVVYSRLPALQDSRFAPVRFTAWLPPFHRQVYTQTIRPARAGGR